MNSERTRAQAIRLPSGHVLHRVRRGSLAVGVVAALACVLGAWLGPQQFFRSYLLAYLFWFGIAMGCLAILMLHHVAGGVWGAVIRRLLEAGTRTLPFLAALFLPLTFGLTELYEWAQPEHVAHDPVLQHKSVYLNVPFFLARAVFYFLVWIVLAVFLNRWSLREDIAADGRTARRLELLSRGGLLLFGFTMTFASVDWIMSLEPHWFSTIYGILVMWGQVLTAMAFVVPLTALLASPNGGPLAEVISTQQFHDLGKLLLAFVMLWAYFTLSQYLIIWSGNLPEETPWYLARLQGGWQWIGVTLIAFHFALPFLLLLSRDVKRNPRILAWVAIVVVAVRFVDLFWLIVPAFEPKGLTAHWMDAAAFVGIGGFWLALFIWELGRRSLLAHNDVALAGGE
jgi:hypothetical protein